MVIIQIVPRLKELKGKRKNNLGDILNGAFSMQVSVVN